MFNLLQDFIIIQALLEEMGLFVKACIQVQSAHRPIQSMCTAKRSVLLIVGALVVKRVCLYVGAISVHCHPSDRGCRYINIDTKLTS